MVRDAVLFIAGSTQMLSFCLLISHHFIIIPHHLPQWRAIGDSPLYLHHATALVQKLV
jgi:hypothetical protein